MLRRFVIWSATTLVCAILLFEAISGTLVEGATLPLLLIIVISGFILLFASLAAFRNALVMISGALIFSVGLLWLFGSFGRGGDRVIGPIKMADGREVCILHSYSGDVADPYYVTLCSRKPGANWRQFLLRRGDTRWWLGRIESNTDGKTITARKLFFPVARYSLEEDQVTYFPSEATSGQGEIMPPTWSPQEELRLDGIRAALPK